jgi:hypothetical protein
VRSFRSHYGIAVHRPDEWAERGEITLEAAARIMDVSVMTALRMVRQGVVKGRQICRGAPWAIDAEDVSAYRARNESQRPLTTETGRTLDGSKPAQDWSSLKQPADASVGRLSGPPGINSGRYVSGSPA